MPRRPHDPTLPALEVDYVPVDALVPYARNAKLHPDAQVAAIAASIERFGECDPVGVWTNADGALEIVEGHGRVLALKRLGRTEVPVIRLDHLDDAARRAYGIVHNQTTMSSGFDEAVLAADMADLPEFEWGDLGFEPVAPGFFDVADHGGRARQDGNDEYNEFLEKFEDKRTTDDCYTPPRVYDAVADWTAATYGVDRSTFVRPFYPGGDYQRFDYPEGCVVVDNPPFSIETEIIRWYCARGVRFLLFGPTLTAFSGFGEDVTYLLCDGEITYENGAVVDTSFVTNLDPDYVVRTAPDLTAAIKAADKESRAEVAKPVNLKYRYPPEVLTAVMASSWSALGIDFRVRKGGATLVRALDAMKPHGKGIYGSGLLLCERAKADAERAKADAIAERLGPLGEGVEVEPDGSVVWRLSDREREIVRSLG